MDQSASSPVTTDYGFEYTRMVDGQSIFRVTGSGEATECMHCHTPIPATKSRAYFLLPGHGADEFPVCFACVAETGELWERMEYFASLPKEEQDVLSSELF